MVANDPVNQVDPYGEACQTVEEVASCTIDTFEDAEGNEISRQKAMEGRNGRAIRRLESKLTQTYKKAQNLASNSGSVTVRGDSREGMAALIIGGGSISREPDETREDFEARATAGTPAAIHLPENGRDALATGEAPQWAQGALAMRALRQKHGHTD